jgi:hypothetical protein
MVGGSHKIFFFQLISHHQKSLQDTQPFARYCGLECIKELKAGTTILEARQFAKEKWMKEATTLDSQQLAESLHPTWVLTPLYVSNVCTRWMCANNTTSMIYIGLSGM